MFVFFWALIQVRMPIQFRHLDQGGAKGADPKAHSKTANKGAPASGGATQRNGGQNKARPNIDNKKGGTQKRFDGFRSRVGGPLGHPQGAPGASQNIPEGPEIVEGSYKIVGFRGPSANANPISTS
jgi:hypothetical protein